MVIFQQVILGFLKILFLNIHQKFIKFSRSKLWKVYSTVSLKVSPRIIWSRIHLENSSWLPSAIPPGVPTTMSLGISAIAPLRIFSKAYLDFHLELFPDFSWNILSSIRNSYKNSPVDSEIPLEVLTDISFIVPIDVFISKFIMGLHWKLIKQKLEN